MAIESRIRVPIEGTARSKVYKVITEGKAPIWDTRAIAEESGLTVRQATIARSNLRGAGYLPKPTPELTRLTQHAHAATIFPLVKEYRNMGLAPREIQLAVMMEKGIELSENSVHGSLVYSTKIGSIRRLSVEESRDIRRDVNMLTQEKTAANVIAILELRKFLLEHTLSLPTNRLEWKALKNCSQSYELRGLPLPELTDLNKEDINFANRLIMGNIIGNDVGYFEAMRQLYIARKKDFDNLPPEIKLRLEAFARAITQEVQEKNIDLRTKFVELGLQSGKEWFYNQGSVAVNEQRFIADKIRNGRT